MSLSTNPPTTPPDPSESIPNLSIRLSLNSEQVSGRLSNSYSGYYEIMIPYSLMHQLALESLSLPSNAPIDILLDNERQSLPAEFIFNLNTQTWEFQVLQAVVIGNVPRNPPSQPQMVGVPKDADFSEPANLIREDFATTTDKKKTD